MAKRKKTRIRFNYAGFNAVRRSEGVRADLEARAQRIAAAAGPGFETKSTLNPGRAGVLIFADTHEAMVAEAEDKALTRAIDAGRG
ncbi:hypothetical protein [Glutamicibacter arilaitensis]|uniref:Uncharacterized protein n=1 Tax=Glutamicibacter arilaitensis TaxID=256701 RepID=A0A2N7S648_9MICC|nr:hypothetical protein [Glutamicibacter arilaitensis]PMQ21621.1 hypothetical protein CIK84_08855 [Glutamicibacter arilaitensis]